MTQALDLPPVAAAHGNPTQFGSLPQIEIQTTVPATGNPKSPIPLVTHSLSPPQEHVASTDAKPNSNTLLPTSYPTPEEPQPTVQNPTLPTPSLIPTPTLADKLRTAPPPTTPAHPVTTPTKPLSVSLPSSPSASKSVPFVPSYFPNTPIPSTESPPDKPTKPSLKRSRSSPILSPPPPFTYKDFLPELSTPPLLRNWHYILCC
ncbi:hypothetical protein YC2023_019307 [Brassica napus]